MSDNESLDPNEVFPGGLTRAQFLELREVNPFVASNYAITHRIYETCKLPPNPGDPRVRFAHMRGGKI